MRCYRVLVHGRLRWGAVQVSTGVSQPLGFLCNRYVLAADEHSAAHHAFRRVRRRLARWLAEGSAELTLQADEVSRVAVWNFFRPVEGHIFYDED